jgi:hypothetical protein
LTVILVLVLLNAPAREETRRWKRDAAPEMAIGEEDRELWGRSEPAETYYGAYRFLDDHRIIYSRDNPSRGGM